MFRWFMALSLLAATALVLGTFILIPADRPPEDCCRAPLDESSRPDCPFCLEIPADAV